MVSAIEDFRNSERRRRHSGRSESDHPIQGSGSNHRPWTAGWLVADRGGRVASWLPYLV